MRLLGWLIVGLALAFPVLVPAQAVKRVDVVGTWWGRIVYKDRPHWGADRTWEATTWLALWPDGLWWYTSGDSPSSGRHGAQPGSNGASSDRYLDSHGGGRWRLVGNTLWLGQDDRYHVLKTRTGVLRADTVDTATMRLKGQEFPKNDSLFWTTLNRAGFWYTAYKISLVHQRLSMTRIDRLSNNKTQPGSMVVERRHAPAYGLYPHP